MNYYTLLKKHCVAVPDKLLIRCDDEELTYGDMLALADELAKGIKQWVQPTKPILIISEDPVYQAGSFLAVEKLGAIPVLMHNGCKNDIVERILSENNFFGLWLIGKNHNNFRIWHSSGTDHQIEGAVMGALTSGSTGTPKVMYRSFASWAGFFTQQNDVFRIDGNCFMFIQGSMSFTGNLNMFMGVLAAGGSVITCRKISARHWTGFIQKNNATHIYMVPAKLQLLWRKGPNDNKAVKCIIAGSQLFDEENWEGLVKTFPKAEIILYYGSGELSYISYRHLTGGDIEYNNLGRPFEGIKVFSEDGNLFVDTPFHINGINMPYCCGDTGYVNHRGEIIFTGRKTDWINKGGYKISAIKLEQQIGKLDGVQDVVVLPYADKHRGQEIAAFVVLKDGLTAGGLRRYFSTCLDERERPKKIVVMDNLPLNDRGKVDKELLKEYV